MRKLSLSAALVCLVSVAIATPSSAQLVLCTRPNGGRLNVRIECRPREVIADPAALGLVGPAGPQGQTGPAGQQGEMGVPGNDGAPGMNGMNGMDGAPGPQGPIGQTGPAGAHGETGEQGPQGVQGVAGNDGEQGPQGPIGNTGPQGEPGNDGVCDCPSPTPQPTPPPPCKSHGEQIFDDTDQVLLFAAPNCAGLPYLEGANVQGCFLPSCLDYYRDLWDWCGDPDTFGHYQMPLGITSDDRATITVQSFPDPNLPSGCRNSGVYGGTRDVYPLELIE